MQPRWLIGQLCNIAYRHLQWHLLFFTDLFFPMSLKELTNLLAETSTDWFSLGLQLNLLPGKLREIEHNSPRDVIRCMILMLQEWQRQPNLNPAWCTLVGALRTINKNVIAGKISTKYSKSFVDDYADERSNFSGVLKCSFWGIRCQSLSSKFSDWFIDWMLFTLDYAEVHC